MKVIACTTLASITTLGMGMGIGKHGWPKITETKSFLHC